MWVIKPGYFEKKVKGMRQPGLDFGRAIGDWLKGGSLAVTSDCCNYYPTLPLVTAADASAPTETEMAGVPLWGMFRTFDSDNDYTYLFIKTAADATITIADNAP